MPSNELIQTLALLREMRQTTDETTGSVTRLAQAVNQFATQSTQNVRGTLDALKQLRELRNLGDQLSPQQLENVNKAINALETGLQGVFQQTGQVQKGFQNISTAATAAGTAAGAAIGKMVPPTSGAVVGGIASPTNILQTIGRISSDRPGVSGSLNDFVLAQRNAIQALKDSYPAAEGWALALNKLDTVIDAHTGKVRVMTRATRNYAGAQQRVNAVAFAGPRGPGSTLQPEQDAFIRALTPAGGLLPEQAYERADQALQRYGFSLSNIIGVQKDFNSNITKFVAIAEDGFTQANFQIDRFGNLTLNTARNAQTLVQNIERNVTKVIEWSIATGLVYSVIAAIPAAARGMQDIEQTFADIATATGASEEALQSYYDTALEVANLTGTEVATALQAQQRALKATADLQNRSAVSTQLLTDSMILARLSGMDQVEALDTLLGALRQTGMELDQGTALLDKWVKVSRNAGVSVEDLAESFAITGTVAETAGVSVDQLNGLIAVLAENTTLSATEVGNALRTMLANVTAPEAMAQLEQFGISVRDINGELRSWTDITQNIVDLMNAGVLNDEQINKLANALGGGSRRGPQILAIWQNFDRVNAIAGESMTASGDAAEAMQRKTETLNAAVNELNNAFNELIQSLGFEGGFLELMKGGIELITELVRELSDLTDSLGGSTAAIAGALAGYGILTRMTGGGGFVTGNLFAGAAMGAGLPGVGQLLGTPPVTMGQAALQGATGPGLAIAGVEIARGIAGEEQAWARAGGAITGAIVGNMILPGAGGLIGAVIADGIVAGIQSQKESVDALFEVDTGATIEELNRALEGILIDGRVGAAIGDNMLRELDLDEIAQIIRENEDTIREIREGAGIFSLAGSQFAGRITDGGFTPEERVIAAATGLRPEAFDELMRVIGLWEDAKQEELEGLQSAVGAFTPGIFTDIRKLAESATGQALGTEISRRQEALFQEAMGTGDIAEYNKFLEISETLANIMPQLATALGGVSGNTERYIQLAGVVAETSDEARSKIIQYTSNIIDLEAELERLQDPRGRDRRETLLSQQEINEQLEEERQKLEEVIFLSEQLVAVERARETFIAPTEVPEGLDRGTVREQLEQARIAQDEYARFLEIDPEILKQALAEPIVLAYEDGFNEVIEGLIPAFQQEFLQKLSEISEELDSQLSFTFRDLSDIDIGQQAALQARISQMDQFLQQRYGPLGFEEEPGNIGVRFDNNQFGQLYGTATATQLVLEEMLEVEKKQLEGFWNLPAGATAYVPITSLFGNANSGLPGGPVADFSGIEDPIKRELPAQTKLLSVIAAKTGAAGIPSLGRTGLEKDDLSFAELMELTQQRDADVRTTALGRTGTEITDRSFMEIQRSLHGVTQSIQQAVRTAPPIDLNVNVRSEPTVNVRLDGRVIANVVSESLVRRYRQQIRTGGVLPGGVRVQ